MQRIATTLLFLFALILSLQAQPSVFGTELVNGDPNYTTYDLTDKGAFRQVRLQAASTGASRIWEFARGTAVSPDYFINWRPYSPGQTLIGFNAVISPAVENASARYNDNFGGVSGLLPSVVSGHYYTVNVTESIGPNDNFMAILETTYTPAAISSVSGPACATNCGYTVTVDLSNAPDSEEYTYVRYSTDGFTTSSLVAVNFSGTTGTATIPDQGSSTVTYYVYTSPNTLTQINSAVSAYGSLAHDMLTLELGNNGGSNYSYGPCPTSNPMAVCQNTTVSLDNTGNATITGADIDGGSTDNCGVPSLSASPAAFTCNDVIAETPTELFFSEYLEGSSSNKYLEIFNGTGAAVDLSNYQVRLYSNGATSPNNNNTLSGMLNPGEVIVLANSSAAAYTGTVTTASAVNFNGDDAIELYNIDQSATVDIIGNIGEDPGTQWTMGGNSTLNKTLRRKMTVTGGVTTNPVTGFPTLADEWDVFDIDDVSGLGSHAIGVPVILTTTGTGGVQSTCQAVVTVIDDETPNPVCQDITVDIEEGDIYILSATEINGGSSDNCAANLSIPSTVFDCNDVGSTISVTLTVSDNVGNTSSCSADVTVADGNNICNQAPTAACQPVIVDANTNCQGTATAADFDGGSTDPEMGMLSFEVSPSGPYPLGETGVTLTVTDPGGASDDCMTTITVVDNTAPTITCPDAVSVNANGLCQALVPSFTGSSVALANSVTGFSGAQGANGWSYGQYFAGGFQNFSQLPTYNSGVPQWQDSQSFTTPFLDAFGGHPGVDDLKQAVRRWVSSYTGMVDISLAFYDRDGGCGDGAHVRVFLNGTQVWEYLDIPTSLVTQSFNQPIIAGDILDFVIDPKFDAGCDNTQFTAMISASNGLTTSDNCGPVTVAQTPEAGMLVALGVTQVTLTATDGNSNTSEPCTVDLTVVDNTTPTAACLSTTVQLDASGMGSITTADVFDTANSSDNCGTVNPQSVSPNSFTCTDVGTNTVTLTVNDGNGNTSTCSATVTVNPGSEELCGDGIDNDCDGLIDDDDPSVVGQEAWYADNDEDSYGDPNTVMMACTQPPGFVSDDTDCDDDDPAINPGATESCNGLDDDCNDQIDDGLTFNDWYLDSDNDTYGAGDPINDCQSPGTGYVLQGGDCDDGDPAINPGATESCNGLDDDCNDQTDDGLTFNDWYLDNDNDTYGAGDPINDCQSPGTGYVLQGGDCDDGDPAINPGATESCDDIDNDCDDLVDNNDPSLVDGAAPTAVCQATTVQLNASGVGSIMAVDVFDAANSSDNCGTVIAQSVSFSSFTCADVGTQSVTLTVSDGNGNTSDCLAMVIVEDPTGTCSQVFCFDAEIAKLVVDVEGMGLRSSIERAITSRLELAAEKYCRWNNASTTIRSLEIIIRYVQAQRNRNYISSADASYIIAQLEAFIDALDDGIAECCSDASRPALPTNPVAGSIAYELEAAPNPFRSETLLSFSLPKAGPMALEVFNLQGQRVHVLQVETLDAGYHTQNWNGATDGGQLLSAGIYLIRLTTGSGVLVKKVSLVR